MARRAGSVPGSVHGILLFDLEPGPFHVKRPWPRPRWPGSENEHQVSCPSRLGVTATRCKHPPCADGVEEARSLQVLHARLDVSSWIDQDVDSAGALGRM